MRRSKSVKAWVLTLCMCFAFMPLSSAQVVEPLLVSGQTAPGTSLTFDSFISPWEDETGLIVFQAVLSDGTRGVWQLDNGALSEVIRQGQTLPGSPDYIVGSGAPVIIAVEDGGFAFWIGLENNEGAILAGDRNGVTPVAITGTPAPGAGDFLFNNLDVSTLHGALSFGYNNGSVVFTALAADSTVSEAANGVWVSSGGIPTLLALGDKDQFDEVDEWPEIPGHVFEFKDVHIGDQGTVYARVRAVDPVAEYLVRISGGSRVPLDLGAGNRPIIYSMSADEQVAVVIESDAGIRSLLIETSPGSGVFETVATVGDVTPGRDGNPLPDVTWTNFGRSGIGFDSRGNLYFDGEAKKGGMLGTFNRFWKRSPDGNLVLHIDGGFDDNINAPTGLALNRKGDMLLGENGNIYYQAVDSQAPNKVFGRRDELAVAPGDVRIIDSGFLANTYFNSPAYDGRSSTLTEEPALLATVRFSDRSFAVIRFSSLSGGMVVNSTGDGSDTSPGNGVCSTGGDVNGESECTLRAAIEEANATAERTAILFDIPGAEPYDINVGSPLPAIINPITITGPTYSDLPSIRVYGESAGEGATGLSIESIASGSSVRNLWFLGFGGPGMEVVANEVTLEGNVLGREKFQLNGNGVGLVMNGDANTIANNLISGNMSSGLSLRGSNNVVFKNIIGLDRDGLSDLGNQADGVIVVGDRNQFIENTISRNSRNGVLIASGDANELYKNFIGTDSAGRNRLGNLENGIQLSGATNTVIGASGEGNVISGNIGNGVFLTDGATGTLILDNFIGVGPQGVVGPFNVNAGVFIQSASGNNIGGIDAETGNVIRDNEFGVVVAGDAQDNTIRHNAIFGNRTLDIDLGNDGKVTPNDLGNGQDAPDQDAGPNGLINFPVAVTVGKDENGDRTLSGWIDVPDPSNTTIDIYGLNEPHESGVGGGFAWIGSGEADSSGVFQFVLGAAVSYPFFSATATSIDGATSEFSPVCGDPDGDGKADSDEDGLCDDWEINGIDYDMDGVIDLQFTERNALDPMQKDLLVEVDWMETTTGTPHSHEPLQASLDRVKDAFIRSPVTNPNGKTGIRLHLIKDEAVREITPIRMNSSGVDVNPAGTFDDLKYGKPVNPCGTGATDGYFGKKADRQSSRCMAILGARRLVFRYLIFGHDHAHKPGSSGIAELPGNDFMVTVGSWGENDLLNGGGFRQGARAQLAQAKAVVEASTLMHEMGHTLNLKHGGGDHFNCKPNYISVMNYSLQFPNRISQRPMNYSTKALASLNESALNEMQGIGGNAGEFFLYNPSTVVGMSAPRAFYDRANSGSVDWTGDQTIDDENVSADIDYLPSSGCRWQPMLRTLAGHDDWSSLVYDFRTTLEYDEGSQRPSTASFEPEPNADDVVAAAMNFDFDGDGLVNALDNCAAIENPGQEDVDLDGIGDVCEMGQADLSITADVRNFSTDPGAATQREHFRFVITNAGPDSVGTVVLADTLFATGRVEALTASSGGCAASGTTVNCTADGLAVGDSLVVTFEVELTNQAQVSFVASVTGDAVDNNPEDNRVDRTITVGTQDVDLPLETTLYQNFPNPFTSQTRIAFDLNRAGHVRGVVYDLLGREVMRFVDGLLVGGHHERVVDGGSLASGVYMYRLEVNGEVFTRRMIVIR